MATARPTAPVTVDIPLEAAILQLQSAFKEHGFDSTPEKLEYLLRHYGRGDEGDKGRKALYKRLYGLLWYGSGKTLGATTNSSPTYVYPSALKLVVRARYPQVVKDWEDPNNPKVYRVTYKDLFEANWPNPPKAKKK